MHTNPASQIRFYIYIDVTYDMDAYVGKDRNRADVTPTGATLKQSTEKAEGYGCKLFIDNSFLSPDLFSNLRKNKFNCCRAVRPNRVLLAACFLVSHLTYISTLKMGQYDSPKHQ
jgi:hypothetical protein